MQSYDVLTYLWITNVHHFIREYVFNNGWLYFGIVHTHGGLSTVSRLFLILFCLLTHICLSDKTLGLLFLFYLNLNLISKFPPF